MYQWLSFELYDELLKPFEFYFKELYGWTMDAIVKQIGLKNNCKSSIQKDFLLITCWYTLSIRWFTAVPRACLDIGNYLYSINIEHLQ